MISKREFANVVNQVNARFDWFTSKIEELEKEIDGLKPKEAPKKAADKKTTKAEEAA